MKKIKVKNLTKNSIFNCLNNIFERGNKKISKLLLTYLSLSAIFILSIKSN